MTRLSRVVAGDRHDHVGAFGAGLGERARLVGVALQHHVAELVGDELHPVRRVLDDQHLVRLLDQLAGQVEADLPAAGDDRVHR